MMDYSKKHNISVYLTEEQLNERIAQLGNTSRMILELTYEGGTNDGLQ